MKRRITLSTWALNAVSEGLMAALRPHGCKLDEKNAKLLMHVTTCSWGIRIGDTVKATHPLPPAYYMLEGKPTPIGWYFSDKEYVVMCFAELSGKISQTQFNDVFCVLGVLSYNAPLPEEVVCDRETGKVLLFWPGCLEKVPTTNE